MNLVLVSVSKCVPDVIIWIIIVSLQEILRSRTETEREVLEHVLKHIKGKRDVHKTSGLKKWLAMRLKMNGFNASFCQTSWATSLGCPGGEFLSLSLSLLPLILTVKISPVSC